MALQSQLEVVSGCIIELYVETDHKMENGCKSAETDKVKPVGENNLLSIYSSKANEKQQIQMEIYEKVNKKTESI